MQAQIRRSDGLILALGSFPSGSPDPGVDIVDLTPEQLARLSEPGQKVLNADGTITVTPPDPPAIVYAGEQTLTNRVTTTGTTPRELFRRTLAPLTVYTALVDLIGIDSGNGATRYIRASVVVKRLNNGALIVGAPVVIANHADTAAATWAVTPSVSGADFIISCTGAAGRSVDWFVRLNVNSFSPGGM